jgi:hypothetical protein
VLVNKLNQLAMHRCRLFGALCDGLGGAMLKMVRVHEWLMFSTARSVESRSHIGFLEF